ncbi:MAG: hypothetical protein QME63_09650 [Actinomycetota bacterium]|nr:hypothetical protein [Actinomycetota bacterium]
MTSLSKKQDVDRLPIDNQPASTVRWSVDKVESLVNQLGIEHCEFVYQPKLVRLSHPMQLYELLTKIVTSELTPDCKVNISKFGDRLRLDVGGWRFEVFTN